jgi:hypothetical protein
MVRDREHPCPKPSACASHISQRKISESGVDVSRSRAVGWVTTAEPKAPRAPRPEPGAASPGLTADTRPRQVVTRAAFATRTQDNMRWTAVVQPRLVSSKSSAMLESNAVASRLNVSIRRPKLVAWLPKAPLYQLHKSGAVLMHNHPSPTQSAHTRTAPGDLAALWFAARNLPTRAPVRPQFAASF